MCKTRQKGVYIFLERFKYLPIFSFYMVIRNNPLSGEERKIVSARLYKSEFLYFKKMCEQEGKSINKKLREMIRKEIKLEDEE